MPSALHATYDERLAAGDIRPDPAQGAGLRALERLEGELAQAHPGGGLASLFRRRPAPRGVYLWGPVGRGKSMLMDLFFETVAVEKKRRTHFHVFMGEIHRLIDAWRKGDAAARKAKFGQHKGDDPIVPVADMVANDARLLCFDEFQVTDIADAMILGRLFSRLFELGTVVVATSNVAPEDLYKGGLNRALFLPFIAQIEARMDVLRLDARTDFRMEKLAGVKMWLAPADASADAALDKAWVKLTGNAPCKARDISIKGRILHVPCSAHGVARFSFADLCERPLGASDYLRLAHDYHTLMIDRIPMMTYAERNAAKRFIALIDALYDNGVKLMASSAADPLSLYQADDGFEANEFKRTSSRLIEMGSESYLAQAHGRSDSAASGATTGLVET